MKLFKNEEHAFLEIRDTGKGIPPHLLEQIGQKGITTKLESPSSGSGLGIYDAKKNLARWGGTIEISSVQNDGTTVLISLPLA